MNKAEMADRLAARTGMNEAAAKDAVDSVFATIGEALANGDEVRIAGYGTFAARARRPVPAATPGPARRSRYRRRSHRRSRRGRHSGMRWTPIEGRDRGQTVERDE